MLMLDAMTQEEFDAYLSMAVDAYAVGTARAWKRPLEEVQERAQKDYRELLPQGLQSPNNFLFTARLEEEAGPANVGMTWFAITERPTGKSAYIYDILVNEAWRGKGIGRQLLAATEAKAVEQGATRIGLNVFGSNTVARALYESAGFEVGAIGMFKNFG